MLHKPFRDESELIEDCTSYVDAYTTYLNSGNIPPCLQDDIHRLQQQSNDSSQEQAETELVPNHHNVRQVEEWMILCQQHH